MKQGVKPELLDCTLPLHMPLSLFSLLPSLICAYLLPFKSALCGAGTCITYVFAEKTLNIKPHSQVFVSVARGSRCPFTEVNSLQLLTLERRTRSRDTGHHHSAHYKSSAEVNFQMRYLFLCFGSFRNVFTLKDSALKSQTTS